MYNNHPIIPELLSRQHVLEPTGIQHLPGLLHTAFIGSIGGRSAERERAESAVKAGWLSESAIPQFSVVSPPPHLLPSLSDTHHRGLKLEKTPNFQVKCHIYSSWDKWIFATSANSGCSGKSFIIIIVLTFWLSFFSLFNFLSLVSTCD